MSLLLALEAKAPKTDAGLRTEASIDHLLSSYKHYTIRLANHTKHDLKSINNAKLPSRLGAGLKPSARICQKAQVGSARYMLFMSFYCPWRLRPPTASIIKYSLLSYTATIS